MWRNKERLVERTAVMVGEPKLEKLETTLEAAVQPEVVPKVLSVVLGRRSNLEWRGVERARSLGYNGQSAWTKRRQEKAVRDKEMEDKQLRNG